MYVLLYSPIISSTIIIIYLLFNRLSAKTIRYESIQAFLVLFLSLLFLFSAQAQWSPANLQSNTYRYGSVQIGTDDLPLKGRLEVKRVTPGTATVDPFPFIHVTPPGSLPHLHLSSEQGESALPGWDITGGYSLSFQRDGQNIVHMNPKGVNITGDDLIVGGDFYLGQNTASPDGSEAHFLSFGLTPASSGFGASATSGGLFQVTSSGDMYFYAKPGAIGGIQSGTFEQYNTFAIKNDGKIGIGTINPTQLLTISTEEGNPVFRLENQKDSDWEIYTNSSSSRMGMPTVI